MHWISSDQALVYWCRLLRYDKRCAGVFLITAQSTNITPQNLWLPDCGRVRVYHGNIGQLLEHNVL